MRQFKLEIIPNSFETAGGIFCKFMKPKYDSPFLLTYQFDLPNEKWENVVSKILESIEKTVKENDWLQSSTGSVNE